MLLLQKNMTYTIIIKKNERVTRPKAREWVVVGKKSDGSDEYDYAPVIEEETSVETKMFEQVVDTLDMGAVINAVNGLPK